MATPDLLFLIELYKPNKTPIEKAYIEWSIDNWRNIESATSYEDTFVINNFFRDWDHKFIYDEKVLRGALEHVGFVDIVRRELHESLDQHLRGLEFKSRYALRNHGPSSRKAHTGWISKYADGFLDLETMVLEAVKRTQ